MFSIGGNWGSNDVSENRGAPFHHWFPHQKWPIWDEFGPISMPKMHCPWCWTICWSFVVVQVGLKWPRLPYGNGVGNLWPIHSMWEISCRLPGAIYQHNVLSKANHPVSHFNPGTALSAWRRRSLGQPWRKCGMLSPVSIWVQMHGLQGPIDPHNESCFGIEHPVFGNNSLTHTQVGGPLLLWEPLLGTCRISQTTWNHGPLLNINRLRLNPKLFAVMGIHVCLGDRGRSGPIIPIFWRGTNYMNRLRNRPLYKLSVVKKTTKHIKA